MKKVIVVPYNAEWATEFEKIKAELTQALRRYTISIEHVGSTSVPNLAAKPIIDIDIVIEIGMFEKVKYELEQIGYRHEGDLGILGREAFKYENKEHLMKHHLYVCNKNSSELRRHITFRDWLRSHAEDRDAYANIKMQMAAKYPQDMDSYIAGKTPVVEQIYKKCGLI